MSHGSRFFLRTLGGECAGQRWIFDGDEPIALLERRTIDQPEQNLRYFNLVPRPINLRHLKLRPRGRPAFSGVQLYWKLSSDVITSELAGLEVEGEGTETLRICVRTRAPSGAATAQRTLVLSYDGDIESYVYDFECRLEIIDPEVLDPGAVTHLEYSDPWYVDIPGPAVQFPGMWRRAKWTHLLCDRTDGVTHAIPLNHAGVRKANTCAVRPGGLVLPAFEEGNNPAIELTEVGPRDYINLCHWGYDVHLIAVLEREELHRPVKRRFRMYNCPDERARRMFQSALHVGGIEINGMTVLPLYERRTSFERACALNEPPSGPTDPWSWIPVGRGLEYERDFGRSDRCSLKISKREEGLSMWEMAYEGEGGFCEPWPDEVSYVISGWVRTKDVRGRGSCIAVRWQRYNQPQVYPYTYSRRLTGTNDWTRLWVEISGRRPADSSAVGIALMQDGSGTTWFDDLEVVPGWSRKVEAQRP